MAAYLQRIAACQGINEEIPEKFLLDKPCVSIGTEQNDDLMIVLPREQTGAVRIYEENGRHYLVNQGIKIAVNDQIVAERCFLSDQDQITIANDYVFRFCLDKKSAGLRISFRTKTPTEKTGEISSPESFQIAGGQNENYTKANADKLRRHGQSDQTSSNSKSEQDNFDPKSTLRIHPVQTELAAPQAIVSSEEMPDVTSEKTARISSANLSRHIQQTDIGCDSESHVSPPTNPGDTVRIRSRLPFPRKISQNEQQAVDANKVQVRLPFKPKAATFLFKKDASKISNGDGVLPQPDKLMPQHNASGQKPLESITLPRKLTPPPPSSPNQKHPPAKQELFSFREAEMTMMWDTESSAELQMVAELISPASGQIVYLDKEKITIGRSPACDLCLYDEYVSRQHIEISRVVLGFLVKNIGKNIVIVEKKSHRTPASSGEIIIEEKCLEPEDSTLLTQEASIILGNHILYFFNIPQDNKKHLESSARNSKYNFYAGLARQKQELLNAAQFQKVLTSPFNCFDDVQVGMWFRYFAVDDLSGDFFVYHKLPDCVYCCLGDVSGHGPLAALFASQVTGMFKILAQQKYSASEIVHAINEHLLDAKKRQEGFANKHNLYALLNVLRVDANGIELCSAGNAVPPLFFCQKTQELTALDRPSTPTGLFDSRHFRTYSEKLVFDESDMLIMFTDGVTEAEMLAGGLLEYQRAQSQIASQIDQRMPVADFLDSFLTWLTQTSEIKDDLSMVLLSRLDRRFGY